MNAITPHHFLVLAFLLFGVGFLGVVIRRNALLVLMSLELMLNGINARWSLFPGQARTWTEAYSSFSS